jgi:hypothetical protein
MPRRTSLLSAGAALATTAALAGCGSSGPSKADFVKKADALCTQTNKQHPVPTSPPGTVQEAVAQATSEVSVRRTLDAKLKALDVPKGVKSDFDAYNADTAKIIALVERQKADAAAKDNKKYTQDGQAFNSLATAREAIAKRIGFTVCGRKLPQPVTK